MHSHSKRVQFRLHSGDSSLTQSKCVHSPSRHLKLRFQYQVLSITDYMELSSSDIERSLSTENPIRVCTIRGGCSRLDLLLCLICILGFQMIDEDNRVTKPTAGDYLVFNVSLHFLIWFEHLGSSLSLNIISKERELPILQLSLQRLSFLGMKFLHKTHLLLNRVGYNKLLVLTKLK